MYQCIDPDPYEDNFLARRVTAETIDSNALYLRDTEITTFSDVDELIASFNSALYFRHHSRDLVHENGIYLLRESKTNSLVLYAGF